MEFHHCSMQYNLLRMIDAILLNINLRQDAVKFTSWLHHILDEKNLKHALKQAKITNHIFSKIYETEFDNKTVLI